MMALRTSRAPRMHAGQVGESSVRNRASPFFALNAVRTGASVEAVVRSVSCAVTFVAEPVFVGCSVLDFFDSHPTSTSVTANARVLLRMREKVNLDLTPAASGFSNTCVSR